MLKQLQAWWSDVRREAEYSQHSDATYYGVRRPLAWYVLTTLYYHRVPHLVCQVRGHRWAEEVADPEDGFTVVACHRCGEAHQGYMG